MDRNTKDKSDDLYSLISILRSEWNERAGQGCLQCNPDAPCKSDASTSLWHRKPDASIPSWHLDYIERLTQNGGHPLHEAVSISNLANRDHFAAAYFASISNPSLTDEEKLKILDTYNFWCSRLTCWDDYRASEHNPTITEEERIRVEDAFIRFATPEEIIKIIKERTYRACKAYFDSIDNPNMTQADRREVEARLLRLVTPEEVEFIAGWQIEFHAY